MAKVKLTNPCTMYIVRHGETDWNLQDKIQGQANIPLNKNGIKQARQAAERLKEIKFDAAFSSDLIRAKKTAEIIALRHKLAITAHQALRERSFGKLEGLTIDLFEEKMRKLIEKADAMGYEYKYKHQFPYNIETIESSVTRFIQYLREISLGFPNKTVLVTTHGGVMRNFLIQIGFYTEDQLDYDGITNLGHVVVMADGVDFVIKETFGITINES